MVEGSLQVGHRTITPQDGCLNEFCPALSEVMSEAARAGTGYQSAMAAGHKVAEHCVRVEGCAADPESEVFVGITVAEDGSVFMEGVQNA